MNEPKHVKSGRTRTRISVVVSENMLKKIDSIKDDLHYVTKTQAITHLLSNAIDQHETLKFNKLNS
jgi:metal-responsive CopG/Arc/MetJ family transcriptional regulator